MIEKLAPFLKKALPAGIAMKGLSSSSSKMKKFIASAAAAGYSTDVILDFLRGMSKKSGRKEMLENAAFRKSQGTARPDELASAKELEEQQASERALKGAIGVGAGLASAALPAGAIGRAAGSLIPGLIGGTEQPAETGEPGQQPTFFQRAMEGIDFLNLSDKKKSSVGSLMKRLDAMEQQGMSWKDKAVQKVVKAIQKLTADSGSSLVDTEAARFEERYGSAQPQPQPQQENADQQLIAMLEDITNKFLS